jgi:hypothetical protein
MTVTERVQYMKRNGEPYTATECATIERVKDRLMDDRTWYGDYLTAGYEPPGNPRSYATLIQRVGEYASKMGGGASATMAAAMLRAAGVWNHDSMQSRAVRGAVAKQLQGGYSDVASRGGPEAGRPSDHEHKYGLTFRVTLAMWLNYILQPQEHNIGYPWPLEALADHLEVPGWARPQFPRR